MHALETVDFVDSHSLITQVIDILSQQMNKNVMCMVIFCQQHKRQNSTWQKLISLLSYWARSIWIEIKIHKRLAKYDWYDLFC